MPKKRTHSTLSTHTDSAEKRAHLSHKSFSPIKIASKEAAEAVDANPPFEKLLKLLKCSPDGTKRGDCIVYWMRMGDLRINDNRALSRASQQACKGHLPLVVLFVLSPQDYIAHDRGARRIDFTLRNLSSVKASLSELNIPLQTFIHDHRATLPLQVLSVLKKFGSTHLFANIEYELDELRRDIKVFELAKKADIRVDYFHDRCIVEPGVVKTKEGRAYTVYSLYLRQWVPAVNSALSYHLEHCKGPEPNDPSIRSSSTFGPLFDIPLPEDLPSFALDQESGEKERMKDLWPAGEEAAKQILQLFLKTKPRTSQMGAVNPLTSGAESSPKSSRITEYDSKRDRADRDTTSRLSPYLSAGVISARECVRSAMALSGAKNVDTGKTGMGSGVAKWLQEIAWRDFYTNILACYPRVSMGRPFQGKYATIVWEASTTGHGKSPDGVEGEGGNLQLWKDGKTGYPIVDAAMRCVREMGWMHNRLRMICAMFLSKHLMIDWREGEKYFMQILIDGDLASNNGGWQWSASTGVDAAPYFRIFNPYSQSVKADPTGEFIRHWVPELVKLVGDDVHHPSEKVAEKLGYPKPIVKHEEARERALRRYKTPGEA